MIFKSENFTIFAFFILHRVWNSFIISREIVNWLTGVKFDNLPFNKQNDQKIKMSIFF